MSPDRTDAEQFRGMSRDLMQDVKRASYEAKVREIEAARPVRGRHDSPRWCALCDRYGNHHTDRCPNKPASSRNEVQS